MSKEAKQSCKIRPWRMSDAGDLSAAINNKRVQDNLRDGLPYPYTVKDAEDYIQSVLQAGTEKNLIFAITLDDRAIGCIGVHRKENVHARTAEMGYYIAEPYWGRGYGTEAIRQACEYTFTNTDIIRVFAEPYAHNAASCRILEKAGFTLEGVMRKNAVKNGAIIDMKLYALVKE